MNRLIDIRQGGAHSRIMYDPLGRMTMKQAEGQNVFANASYAAAAGQPARPHAMKSAEAGEGVFPTASQTVAYTGFDKVKTIAESGNTLVYTYGYDKQRIRVVDTVDGVARRKVYADLCEFVAVTDSLGSSAFSRTFIVGPYGVFAVVERQGDEETVHYILKDHLGSWTTITDAEGNVEQELSFDAWGNLRDPDTWTGTVNAQPLFDRGFTGHEHITPFGLINMNGRMYDPLTSSFLSVDAYVQDPTSAQAFNRYAYCGYNPLRYTDPTGWHYGPPGTNNAPNINPVGHTQWYSSDPNDVLLGRSVHPSEAGNMNKVNMTSAGYTIGNGYVTGNVPPSHLKAIRAWQDNPCKETSQALEDLGITVNVGCFYGSLYGEDGFRASIYNWTDAAGQAYNATVLDCVGGNENTWYVMTNKTPESYGSENTRIAAGLLNSLGLYSSIEADLSYNKVLGFWRGKNGQSYGMHFNGNIYTGGKLKYAKAMRDKFNAAGRIIGALGTGISVYQAFTETSTDSRIEHTFDAIIGAAGAFYPELFGLPATIWFFGGRQISKWYGEKVITPMIEEGLNPGLMIYQPYK